VILPLCGVLIVRVECTNPDYGLVAVIIVFNWVFVLLVYILLSVKQTAFSKILIYFVQVRSHLCLLPVQPSSYCICYLCG
jgi:hypothetical protein